MCARACASARAGCGRAAPGACGRAVPPVASSARAPAPASAPAVARARRERRSRSRAVSGRRARTNENEARAVADGGEAGGGGAATRAAAQEAAELRRSLQRQLAEIQRTEAKLRAIEGSVDDHDGTGDAGDTGGDRRRALTAPTLLLMEDRQLWPYGHVASSAGDYLRALEGVDSASSTATPPSAFELAARNFGLEFDALMKYIRGEEGGAGVPSQEAAEAGAAASDAASTATVAYARMREQLASLTLSNDAVWERENSREQVRAPWVIKGPYLVLCLLLDTLFDGRPIARFWFLETVARMPYFSYISCLHLYESLGWWRLGIQVKRVHFAEEFNEAHHLLTMEALGGDARWRDRFLAYHSAIVYYWLLVLAWVVSPTLAYNFSELIEAHAVDTYEQFLEENEDTLRELPAPPISKYYWENETFMFDEFQTGAPVGSRRPTIDNLHDVFSNIALDEAAHVSTMADCQDSDFLARSPNYEAMVAASVLTALAANRYLTSIVEEADEEAGGVALDAIGNALARAAAAAAELLPFA